MLKQPNVSCSQEALLALAFAGVYARPVPMSSGAAGEQP